MNVDFAIFSPLSGQILLMLLVAVMVVIAVRLQNGISQHFQLKLFTHWHIGAIVVLTTAPTVSFFLYSNLCRSLSELPLAPPILGLFGITSVALWRFNTSRTNLKIGALATLVQMCAFVLALIIGSVPVVVMETLLAMGAGGMHVCRH